MLYYKDIDPMVKLLLDKGANVTVQDNEGDTPLHYALMNRRTQSTLRLLEAGAPINIANKSEITPLDIGLEYGGQIADLLRSYAKKQGITIPEKTVIDQIASRAKKHRLLLI